MSTMMDLVALQMEELPPHPRRLTHLNRFVSPISPTDPPAAAVVPADDGDDGDEIGDDIGDDDDDNEDSSPTPTS